MPEDKPYRGAEPDERLLYEGVDLDIHVHMPPRRRYSIKARVVSRRRATPNVRLY